MLTCKNLKPLHLPLGPNFKKMKRKETNINCTYFMCSARFYGEIILLSLFKQMRVGYCFSFKNGNAKGKCNFTKAPQSSS